MATSTATSVQLEHVNLTVSDPDTSAGLLVELFGWHVRWSGAALNDGYTVHVGTDSQYLALYRPPSNPAGVANAGSHINDSDMNGSHINDLNHVAIVVDDLDEIEQRVVAAGLTPMSHGDYEPGRRFYFLDRDGVEFEVVSYR